MKYLKSIDEASDTGFKIFPFGSSKRQDSDENPKESSSPQIPRLFGNAFRIRISSNGDDAFSNFFHQVYKLGINPDILAENSIKQYLRYYFKKMDNLKIVETLESLANDYTHSLSNGSSWIEFTLNKTQTIEFLDLIEKASRGLEI